MSARKRFYDKILQNFAKVSSDEKKRLFIRLNESYNSLNLVFENLDEGIIALNTQGIIQGINKKASFLLGIPTNSAGKQIASCLKHLVFYETILSLINKKEGEDSAHINDEQNSRILQVAILPLGEYGVIIGTLVKIFDITETYKREQRLKRAEQLASLTTLAAGVSHEIKNPLGSISIYIQLIEKSLKRNFDCEVKTSEIREYCEIVKEEINRLEDTINSFLFSVRKIDLDKTLVNIRTLILSTLSFLKYEIEKNNIEIDMKFEDDALTLNIDQKYIKQAIINIVQNSIDSMSRAKRKRILISVSCNDRDATISIKDTGLGISENMLGKIFEPYFTTKPHGTGLGLTNVARIIEAHGGGLHVNSGNDLGTEITIKLPLTISGQKFLLSDGLDYG